MASRRLTYLSKPINIQLLKRMRDGKGDCVFFVFSLCCSLLGYSKTRQKKMSLKLEQSPPSVAWSIEALLCFPTYEKDDTSCRLQIVTISTILLIAVHLVLPLFQIWLSDYVK